MLEKWNRNKFFSTWRHFGDVIVLFDDSWAELKVLCGLEEHLIESQDVQTVSRFGPFFGLPLARVRQGCELSKVEPGERIQGGTETCSCS
jgi:hypothetical protein